MEVFNFWLSIVGNITSIIGFIMTIAVLCSIKSLKEFYAAKATLPKQLEELSELREKIDELFIGKFDVYSKNKVIEHSTSAHTSVKNALPKIKEMSKMSKGQYAEQIEPSAKNFTQAYDDFIKNPTKENARIMNRHLFEFSRSTELVINEDNWRRAQ